MKGPLLVFLIFVSPAIVYAGGGQIKYKYIVRIGLDRLLKENFDLIKGKRIGLVTNQTGITRNIKSNIDTLTSIKNANLVALFVPEHGLMGCEQAGEHIKSYKDTQTGIQVYSLYGKSKKPTPQMLKNIDLLLFDIQDIGARFYTYISTLKYVLEEAAECGVKVLILDRPNPITGNTIEGPVLDTAFSSFVGIAPIPIRHGMTVGELALMFNDIFSFNAEIEVLKMEAWQRNMWFDETGLPWVAPSPNIPNLETAIVYPGICLLESTNISCGRGTTRPFLLLGAPWINANILTRALNQKGLPGVKFRSTAFIPYSSKYQGERCEGVEIYVLNRDEFQPVRIGLEIIAGVKKLYPKEFMWQPPQNGSYGFDRLMGTDKVRKDLDSGVAVYKIVQEWQESLNSFKKNREKYLLY
ncbi:MAG: DUF1343 domain-containing protein [candidate division WOR-3 bacterium]|nr:DUF1343 domain-containing protein [candidate division WOR-3 bacterium]